MIDMKQYSIAKLYPQLQMYTTPTLEQSFMARWNIELPIEEVASHLLARYRDTCKIISEIWRESQFKIIHKAYLPYFHTGKDLKPDKNKLTSICPKCSSPKPTLKHTLWDCPKIQQIGIRSLPTLRRWQEIMWWKIHTSSYLTLHTHQNQQIKRNALNRMKNGLK